MTIDDVPIALERLLEEEGFSTMTDWSGKEALALSDQAQFDLWLVDEHGADVNSNALLSQLRLRQPGAFLLVMHSGRQGSHNPRVHQAVCKWRHAEVNAGIRRGLAAKGRST
jgi:DNA-binding response OmpR family regulator